MNNHSSHPPAQAFFLNAESGQRFCLYYPVAADTQIQGAVIYIHPFGDEMNMSRRMAALQAQAFATQGFAVLQMDLFGCGDSSGEFCDARWDIWKDDIALAQKWLNERHAVPISLWGLRLGGLLALDFAKHAGDAIHTLILWHPVTSSETFLTQFLRLRLANQMIDDGNEKASGTRALREILAAGTAIEVAGYEIAPAMAAALDALDISTLSPVNKRVHWIDITADATRPMAPANARTVAIWEQEGIDLTLHRVSCPAFWSAQEVVTSPELLSATASILSQGAS
ncbi:MAG TPA: hydrolase 2, exosortase A system-associated [Burkholderiaceae bacterium]|jgi:exosortase A-associated hydrolase 2